MKTLGDIRTTKPTYKQKQSMYNNTRWKRYAKDFKRDHPLCVQCLANGKTSPTQAVDHVQPHGGNDRLFWDESNHQALCLKCHQTKSAHEAHR